MKVLDKNLIVLNLDCKSAEDAIREMGSLMKNWNYVKDSYIDAVLKREKDYPTGLPSKGVCVAIPHTDSSHVNKSAISIGILKNTVNFNMMGNPNVQLKVGMIFLLAIDNPQLQINLLKKLMAIFQNEKLLLELKNSKSKEEIMQLLSFLENEEISL